MTKVARFLTKMATFLVLWVYNYHRGQKNEEDHHNSMHVMLFPFLRVQ